MTLVECERCRKTAALEVRAEEKDSTPRPPKGWTRPSVNYRQRDLCPDCSDALKALYEAFLSNGAIPQPASRPAR